MRTIGIVGLGKLGLPVALAVESKGFSVIGVDPDPRVAQTIRTRRLPYLEAGAQDLLARSKIRLVRMDELAREADLAFVAVQTPHQPRFEGTQPMPDDRADFDYSHLCEAVSDLVAAATSNRGEWQELKGDAKVLDRVWNGRPLPVAIVSTCLPGTFRREIEPLLDVGVDVVYNPFFIAMGTTIRDFLHPEFVLVGHPDHDKLGWGPCFRGLDYFYSRVTDAPMLQMDATSAELTKVAYNALIGQKIVMANAIMELAHKVGADCDRVTDALAQATDRIVSPAYTRGGMGDGGGCLPAGEVVMTEHGPRLIETVEPGDRVLTLDGTLQIVRKRWERPYDGDVVVVSTRGLPDARMTTDHPLMARRDLRGRYATGRRRTDQFPRSDMVETAAEDLTSDHLLTWPDARVAATLPEHASHEYLELAGWWLSEGSAELSARRGRLRFDLHAREVDEAERIAELLAICAPPRMTGRGANATITISSVENRRSVRFGSKGLTERLVGDFGSGAASKFLPPWVLWGCDKTSALVLGGMIRGDGHVNARGVAFSTVSEDLAWGAHVLMTRLGAHPNLRVIPDRPGHQRSFEVRVRNRREAINLLQVLGIPVPVDMDGSRAPRQDEWRPVRRVRLERYAGPVFNLWVEGSNTFVTACGAVHNCHPRDNIALSWLAREEGLSFDVFDAMMRAREAQTAWLARLVIEEADRARLGASWPWVVVLGKAYKPGTNLTIGSPAALLADALVRQMSDRMPAAALVAWYDPMVDAGLPPLERPAVFVVATQHPEFACYAYPEGSVVIDPFRYVDDKPGVRVVRVGERSRSAEEAAPRE